jgi:hypothetical protein
MLVTGIISSIPIPKFYQGALVWFEKKLLYSKICYSLKWIFWYLNYMTLVLVAAKTFVGQTQKKEIKEDRQITSNVITFLMNVMKLENVSKIH